MRFLTGRALAMLLASAGTALAQTAPATLTPGPSLQTPSVDPASVSLTPGPSVAQMPMVMPAYTWSGWYLGANLGGGFGTDPVHITGNTAFGAGSLAAGQAAGIIPTHLADNPSGMEAGLTLGYNFNVAPNWLLGLETDFQWSGINDSQAVTQGPIPALGFVQFNTSAQQRLDWFGTARGRIGFAVSPPLMLYGTGGLAYGHEQVSTAVQSTACAGFCGTSSTGSVKVGWAAGAGWEWMINPNISVKGEYLYMDLGSTTQAYGDFAGRFPGALIATKTSLNDNIFRMGLNYHFNPPPPPPPAPMAMPAPPPAAPKVFIVYFDWDKDVITPVGDQVIQAAADAYKSGAPVQLQVTGYTDRSGSPGYNQRLSERRANNVARRMASLGVPPSQMNVSGRGENDNRVPTAPGVREKENRRVEIISP
jgi:outer membrane immunogenic protein